MDGIRIFCDSEYSICKEIIDLVRKASRDTRKRIVVSCELRCTSLILPSIEFRKMFVGQI